MEFSLLIQGPILSIGKTNHNKPGEINTNIVKFYSENYIYKNLSKYGSLFKKIIISTWSTENTTKLNEIISPFKNVKLIELNDKYKSFIQKKFKNENLISNINNKLKMFNGINKSLKYFNDDEIIIRIRTDQIVQLDYIIKEIKKYNATNKFYVPYLTGTGYFQDFYFAANKKVMEKFLGYYCNNYIEIEYSPHYEFIYRIFINMNFQNKLFIVNSSIGRSIVSKILEKRYFRPLPYNVYKEILWRGDKILMHKSRKIFFSDKFDNYYKVIKINKILRRYILMFSYITPTKFLLNFKQNLSYFHLVIIKFMIILKISKVNNYILRKL